MRLLEQLRAAGAEIVVHKRVVGLIDIAALSAHTGREYALFTRGSRRLLIEGMSTSVPQVDVARAAAFYRGATNGRGIPIRVLVGRCSQSRPEMLQYYGRLKVKDKALSITLSVSSDSSEGTCRTGCRDSEVCNDTS